MAIVFDCPHCKTNYRLEDEFGGPLKDEDWLIDPATDAA